MKKVHLIGQLSLIPLLLASCTTLEPQREGVLDGYTPEQFSSDAGEAPRQTEWWKAFGSEQLNRLMDEAFAGSLTLKQAAARLEQAEAAARKSGAAGKIQLDAKASSSSTHFANADASHTTTAATTLGLYASYEVDLWGELKSSHHASQASYEATQFDLQTAAMTLSAELAQNYFKWQAQTETLAIYKSQLNSNRNKLAALERRYKAGQSSSLDVLQQRQQAAAAEAKIPPVQAAIASYEYKLAVLMGKIPGSDLRLVPEPLPALPPLPAAGLPVTLLQNRPDVQSARLALEAADWNVGAARAARLPTLSLSGSAYTTDEDIENLFDDWVSNLAASLVAPLLDGGSRKAEVDRTQAVSREKIAAYRQAVLEAIQETEDALVGEKHQTEYVAALYKQYQAAQKSESESIRRYQRGVLPFLDTLSAIVSRESLEITHLQARTDLLGDRIQLHRALGGDWTFILEEENE